MVAVCLHPGFSAQDLGNKGSRVPAAASTDMCWLHTFPWLLLSNSGMQTRSPATLGVRGSGELDCPGNSPSAEEAPAVNVLLTKEVTSAWH